MKMQYLLLRLTLLSSMAISFGISCTKSTDSNSQNQVLSDRQDSITSVQADLEVGKSYGGKGFRAIYEYNPSLKSRMIYVVINSGKMTSEIIGVTRRDPSGRSGEGALRSLKAEVVIGSGFISDFSPPTPVGLLIVGGEIIQTVNKRGLSCVLYTDALTIKGCKKEVFNKLNVSGAFQTGPCLVSSSKVEIYESETTRMIPAKRSFLGMRPNGDIVAGITLDPVNLFPLAELLSLQESAGGLGCINAYNLCGGGMEVLSFRLNNQVYTFGNAFQRQSALIVFH